MASFMCVTYKPLSRARMHALTQAAIGFVLYTILMFVAASMLGMATGNGSLDFVTTYILALSFVL
jgi:hypothetical protein